MKEIETSKGRFVVTDMKGEVRINNVQWFIKLSEITEEEASEIVDESFNAYNEQSFVYYGDYVFSGCYIVTAIQSLYSLLKSQGIEITQNTYIFKV